MALQASHPVSPASRPKPIREACTHCAAFAVLLAAGAAAWTAAFLVCARVH